MRSLLTDLRHGVRMLGQKPGFTLVAVLSLGVGIGANTTIFSVVNGIIFRPLPGIKDPSSLVDVSSTRDHGRFDSTSYPDYEYYRDHNNTLDGLPGGQPQRRQSSGASLWHDSDREFL